MPLEAGVQAFVDELTAAGISSNVIAVLVPELEGNEKVATVFKGGVSATKDYKRKMDLVAKQEKDAQDLISANAKLQEQLVKWKTDDVDPLVTKANAAMSEQAALKARISERAKLLKDKYGIEDADVNDLLETTSAVKSAVIQTAEGKGVAVADDGKFVKTEDFNKVSRAMPRLSARLEKIGRQFDKLFTGTDKEFDPDALLDLAEKENLSLNDAFSKLYDVSARQTELANVAKEKEFSDRLAKEKAQWVQQQGTPGAGSVRPGEEGAFLTDVLNRHKDKDGGNGNKPAEPSPIDRVRQASQATAPAEAVNRYSSAFRTQKYKDKGISVEPGA